MAKLLRLLTEKTKAATGGAGEVIWYDSVTADGELKWQDELNEKNADFFFGCDGIFLNYNWKAENLNKSIETLRSRGAIDRSTGWKFDSFSNKCPKSNIKLASCKYSLEHPYYIPDLTEAKLW